jgi:hypothetical protein
MIAVNHWRTIAALAGTLAVGLSLFLAVSASNDIRSSARALCEDTNRLRENQASGLAFQIKSTEQSLRGTLGPALEPFRAQIMVQHERRKKQLAGLRNAARDHPAYDSRGRLRPYAINCNRLFS